jgi:general secretion pathway protein G
MPKFNLLKFKDNSSKISGFTLIELMVSIAIVGVIFGVVISSAAAIQRSGRNAQRETDLRNLQSAIQQYYADHNYYPQTTAVTFTSTSTLSDGPKVYLQKMPLDPQGSLQYCYVSQLNKAGGTCDNTAAGGRCQYYSLCGAKEPRSSAASLCPAPCNAAGYDFMLNPI